MNEAVVQQEKRGFRSVLPAKGRAVAIHLSISLAIFLVLLYFVFVLWFPQPLFQTDGGWQGIRIVFAVDVVLGPLLTFIVFNPTKPRREIVLDLSLIALMQLSALAWGVYTVHGQRPVVMVERDGVFHTATAEAFAKQDFDLADLAKFDSHKPPLIFQRKPNNREEAVQSLTMGNQGTPLSAQVFMYEPFRDSLPDVFLHAAKFETKITDKFPALADEFARLRAKHGEGTVFLPVNGSYGQAIVALSRSGDIVDSLDHPR